MSKTIKKDCHCCHCHHICKPQSFIQLYDKTLVSELTESVRFLSLSNDNMKRQRANSNGVSSPENQSFSTGGYRISTTTVKNDTLHLPGPGTYQISLVFQNNALSNGIVGYVGECVPLDYSVVYNGGSETVVPSCMVPTSILRTPITSRSATYMLHRTYETNPSLRITLQAFDFSKVLDNKLTVDNMILVVQKIENL